MVERYKCACASPGAKKSHLLNLKYQKSREHKSAATKSSCAPPFASCSMRAATLLVLQYLHIAHLRSHSLLSLRPPTTFTMRLVSALAILLVCAPYNTIAKPGDKDKKALRGSPEEEVEEAQQNIAMSEAGDAQALSMLDEVAAEFEDEDEEKRGHAYAKGHEKSKTDGPNGVAKGYKAKTATDEQVSAMLDQAFVDSEVEKKEGGNAYGQKKEGNAYTYVREKKDPRGNAYGKDSTKTATDDKKDGGYAYTQSQKGGNRKKAGTYDVSQETTKGSGRGQEKKAAGP